MIWLLGAPTTLGSMSMDMYLPGLPGATHALHASASAGQLTLTSCMLGIAAGQLIGGPISDTYGRRLPLIFGMLGYVATSLACAAAPTMALLIVMRSAEGIFAGVAIVIPRTIVRDIYSGRKAARMFATLMAVNGIAPVLAPLIGGQLLRLTDWRGVFGVLSGLAAVFTLVTWKMLDETLAAQDRKSGGIEETLSTFGKLLKDREFAPYLLSFSISFGAMFAYISGSAFVLENVYGTSPQVFSGVFAINSLGLVIGIQIGARLLRNHAPARVFRMGLVGVALASVATFVVTLTHASLALLLITFLMQLCAQGLTLPNGLSAAMVQRTGSLGSASALFGLGQYGVGAIVAPLVGLAGAHDALPMGAVMLTCGLAALTISALSGCLHKRGAGLGRSVA